MDMQVPTLIPWIPALAAALCGLCCMKKSLRPLAAWICIAGIAIPFALSVMIFPVVTGLGKGGTTEKAFDWLNIGKFKANFSYHLDSLTMIMLFVVTGVGTLVAIYAAGYMKGDRGYARFFAFVSLFIFAMLSLVMADNLVLLYLGWEGVGLCSYLLIGYYYDKPTAVAAAKKAFIVNRIGDLGFALGIFLIYQTFDTVVISEAVGRAGAAAGNGEPVTAAMMWIPFLLMLGAFGKSAQIPLYVWLPDAMEGPTPVSALIHAATMVTAGVYMIARLLPIFELSPYALPTVATIGALTAVFAGSIAMCQYDLKRVFAYSTVSQLGYMFLGVGVLHTFGGVFHLFTHAFFKALLFLTAGSVMHALAGQLDMRQISGLRHKMPVTCWLMFFGCLSLAGVPFITAGFYSKDMIIAATLDAGIREQSTWFMILAGIAIVTAFVTAYYTFRLWFRVFMGPEQYEMGEEHHHDDAHGNDHGDIQVEHHNEPHEMPWLMNAPLVLLAIGAIAAGWVGLHWLHFGELVQASTAASHFNGVHADMVHTAEHLEPVETYHGEHLLGMSTHTLMVYVSFFASLGGIAVAAYFHWFNRAAADRAKQTYAGIARTLEHKYYIDELYDVTVVRPLHLLGQVFFVIDRIIIDGLVALVGFVPRALGLSLRPTQRGMLQGYGLGMAAGVALLLMIVIMAW